MHLLPIISLSAPAQTSDEAVAAWVFADLPTDPASLVAIFLCLGCVAAVAWFGRSQGPPT